VVPFATSRRAFDYCTDVASDLMGGVPVMVVGAVDTDIAGLNRAAVRANAEDGSNSNSFTDAGHEFSPQSHAALCFIDGDFAELTELSSEPVQRVTVGYVEDTDGSSLSATIDYGTRSRLPVAAP
jgi:hypothetical protein